MLRYIGFFFLVFTFFTSCNSNQSGPCEYFEFKNTKAEIISITPKKGIDGEFDVWLEFDKSSLGKEKQSFGELKGIKITQEFLNKNNLRVGLRLPCVVNEIKPGTGDCTPLVIGWNTVFK